MAGKVITVLSNGPSPCRSQVTDQKCSTNLAASSDGAHRWSVTVTDGVVAIDGDFVDEPERAIVTILARTVPGVTAVRLAQHTR